MKKVIACIMLLLVVTACESPQKTPEDSAQMQWVDIYYENTQRGEAVISSEPCAISSEKGILSMVRAALEQLCLKPLKKELRSPFPQNTTIQELRFEKDTIIIDISKEYLTLPPMQKSIADACIVMTVSNFWSIDAVTICVDGKPQTERLEVNNMVQKVPEAYSGAQKIRIYLKNHVNEELVPVEETVLLKEGILPERIAMEKLLNGIGNPKAISPLPAGCKLLSIDTDARICYVNFSSQLLKINNKESREEQEYRITKAIVMTLTSIDYIDQVQILVDGAKVRGFKSIDLRQTYDEKSFKT